MAGERGTANARPQLATVARIGSAALRGSRVPTTRNEHPSIPFDGLKIDKPVVAEIEHYRAFSARLKASRYSLAKITARGLRRSLVGYRRHLGAFRTCGLTLR
jgi:hypothetical protein